MPSPFDAKHSTIVAKIRAVANKYGIDANIGIWQIWQESRFSPTACSPKQACGIAQFIPATAARFGVDRNSIDSSLEGWGKYMRFLLNKFGGNYSLALAGYNAGEGAVMKYGNKIPPYKETQNYVKVILANAGKPNNVPTVPPVIANIPKDIISSPKPVNTDKTTGEVTKDFFANLSTTEKTLGVAAGILILSLILNR